MDIGHTGTGVAEVTTEQADRDQADRDRGDRWAYRLVGPVCLLAVAPAAYYFGTTRRGTWNGLVDNLGLGNLELDESLSADEQILNQHYSAGFVFAAVAAAVFVACVLVRRRLAREAHDLHDGVASNGMVAAAAVGWGAMFVGAWMFGAFTIAGDKPNTSDAAQHFIDTPAWMLLAVPGYLTAVGASHWFFVRRNQLAPLRRAVGPPVDADQSTGWREKVFVLREALIIETGFGLVYAIEAVGDDNAAVGWADFFGERLAGVLIFPGVFALGFALIMGLFRPTRWMVRSCLARPWSVASLALVAAGTVIYFVGSDTFGGIVLFTGMVIASFTQLGLSESGPQPWIGILFLAALYSVAFFEDDDFGLPSQLIGWLIAAATTVLLLRDLRLHWRRWTDGPVATG